MTSGLAGCDNPYGWEHSFKVQALNSKNETNSNVKIRMFKTIGVQAYGNVWVICKFDIQNCLLFRY